MDIWRANPNVLYAQVQHETESGVYRTDDAGATWRKMSNENPRPMYFSQIRIDPQTDSRIYVLGVSLSISDDAGRTWRQNGAQNIHVDHHAMWINPQNPHHIIIGNDGGVSISHDRSATWVWLNNLPFAQPYHVAFDMQTPYHVCTGLQDNNTWCGPERSPHQQRHRQRRLVCDQRRRRVPAAAWIPTTRALFTAPRRTAA